MGSDVSGTEIEIGREEEKSVRCMGHFLTSPASLIQIYSLSQQTLTFLSRFFFFLRMEEMVKSMMQYKTKIEQLKQEKSSLSITYEVYICHVGLVHRCDPTDIHTEGTVILSWVSLDLFQQSNLQKYRSYISNLERENMMLLNDVKRFETQVRYFTPA